MKPDQLFEQMFQQSTATATNPWLWGGTVIGIVVVALTAFGIYRVVATLNHSITQLNEATQTLASLQLEPIAEAELDVIELANQKIVQINATQLGTINRAGQQFASFTLVFLDSFNQPTGAGYVEIPCFIQTGTVETAYGAISWDWKREQAALSTPSGEAITWSL